jgi:hypothetical protein
MFNPDLNHHFSNFPYHTLLFTRPLKTRSSKTISKNLLFRVPWRWAITQQTKQNRLPFLRLSPAGSHCQERAKITANSNTPKSNFSRKSKVSISESIFTKKITNCFSNFARNLNFRQTKRNTNIHLKKNKKLM